MKKIIACIFFLYSTTLLASNCNILLSFPPGGTIDVYARQMQNINKDITVQYKPGAYSAVAIDYMQQNPNLVLFSPGNMYSTKAPKTPQVELVRIVLGGDLYIVSSKYVDPQILKAGKYTVGIPFAGGGHHVIALQLREVNPDITIVPFGADSKALNSVVSGDVDFYVASGPVANTWIKSFNVKEVAYIPFGKQKNINGIQIKNVSWAGLFVSPIMSIEQREVSLACFDNIVSTKEWREVLTQQFVQPVVNQTQQQRSAMFQEFVSTLTKYGL